MGVWVGVGSSGAVRSSDGVSLKAAAKLLSDSKPVKVYVCSYLFSNYIRLIISYIISYSSIR